MSRIAVIIPTFGRAGRLESVARNVLDNSRTDAGVEFVVEQDDRESVDETARLTGLGLASRVLNYRRRSYAGAVNSAYSLLPPEYTHLFLAADDLDFRLGWDEIALSRLESPFMVAGTNDLHNPYVIRGEHATHYLICRSYLESPGAIVDDPSGHVLFEGYDHNYTDTEFIETAISRGVFVSCPDSVVEHLHYVWGLAADDATYNKGRAQVQADADIFNSRRHLWR